MSETLYDLIWGTILVVGMTGAAIAPSYLYPGNNEPVYASTETKTEAEKSFDLMFVRGEEILYGRFRDERKYNFDLAGPSGQDLGSGNTQDDRFLSLYTEHGREHFNKDKETGLFESRAGVTVRINRGKFLLGDASASQ
jgi:hypothetical protein